MSDDLFKKHEGFEIPENVVSRKKIIRQDRLFVTEKKCFLLLDNQKIEVLNVSHFGIAGLVKEDDLAILKSKFDEKDEHLVTVIFGDTETQKIKLKLARIEKHPQSVSNEFIVGFEAVGDFVAVDRIKAMELADEMLIEQEKAFVEFLPVPADFKLLVFEIKDWLTYLKKKIEAIELLAPVDNAVEHRDFRETIAERVAQHLAEVVPSKFQKIHQMLSGKDEVALAACTKFFRSHLGELVYNAPFAHRAYTKPRGYAGDFEMMNHLYRNEMVGATLFDQCMHKHFISAPAGRAVKNRSFYLLEKIRHLVANSKKDKIRILSVASGPAMEMQMFLKEAAEFKNKTIEFVCLDQDEEALKHAQKEILLSERFLKTGYQFKFVNLAIRNILGRGLPENDFDLIYTAGLFDYFTDPVFKIAAQKLFAGLGSGGSLIIGNFNTDNPTLPLMEMVFDWHLIYRSKDQLGELLNGISANMIVESEPLMINLFAIMQKE